MNTSTICNMILRETYSIWSTRIIDQAGINASAFNTCFCIFTFAVRLTSRIHTSNQRITNFSGRTFTYWFMVFNKTFSSFATIAWFHTNAVYTSFISATFIISYTTGRIFYRNRNTTSIRFRNPSGATWANHGAERNSVHHWTNSGWITRIQFVARIATLFIDASSSGWTIRINNTVRFGKIRNWILFGST